MKIKPKPFLKWAGGKNRMLGKILPKIPEKIGTYYEPFLGGGAVFFELASQNRFEKAVLGDVCPELVNAFRVVRDNVDELIQTLKQPKYVYERKAFLEIRKEETVNPIEMAARTIYLNKTCFNGLYRVNKSGKFNTPFGKYENPNICDEQNLKACSVALKSVKLIEGDFESICNDANFGDAVYYDPPYMPISKTSKFTSYTPGGFLLSDHERLCNLFRKLSRKNVAQALSNSSSPLILEMFKDFEFKVTSGPRSVGTAESRKSVPEIIVHNSEIWKYKQLSLL